MCFLMICFSVQLTAQSQPLDSLEKRLERLEKRLEEEKTERERLKREAEVQKKAAEEYRREYEERRKSSRRLRRERRAEKVRPYRPELFDAIPDSLKSDETVAFFKTGRNRVFQGIEIGFSAFTYNNMFAFNAPDDSRAMELNNATSIYWAINPIEMDIRIVGEYFKLSTGLGYGVKNFSFSNNYFLELHDDAVVSRKIDNPDLTRNRFRTGYLNVPVLFHLNTSSKPSKSISFAFGAVTGVRLFETYRVRYAEQGQRIRMNTNRNWNTNQFNIDARFGVAYGGFQLFAMHSIVPLFRKGFGPQVHPFTIGLSLNTSFDR